jgi:hypothetical protein
MVLPCVPILVDRDASCVPVERTLRDLHRDDNHAPTFPDAIGRSPSNGQHETVNRSGGWQAKAVRIRFVLPREFDAIALPPGRLAKREPAGLRIAPIDLIPHTPRLSDSRFAAEGSSE